jgi:hypothetical protein
MDSFIDGWTAYRALDTETDGQLTQDGELLGREFRAMVIRRHNHGMWSMNTQASGQEVGVGDLRWRACEIQKRTVTLGTTRLENGLGRQEQEQKHQPRCSNFTECR